MTDDTVTLEIAAPDDWHVHLRDDELLMSALAHSSPMVCEQVAAGLGSARLQAEALLHFKTLAIGEGAATFEAQLSSVYARYLRHDADVGDGDGDDVHEGDDGGGNGDSGGDVDHYDDDHGDDDGD